MSTTNQSAPRSPRLNALADQFRQHRKDLIGKVKDLRAKRALLRGVKGSSKEWASLSEEIDSVQNQIDKLSSSLGIPVKPLGTRPADTKAINKAVNACKAQNRGNVLPTRSEHSVLTKDCRVFAEPIMESYAEPVNKMVMDKADQDAWDKLQNVEEDFK